MASFAIRISTPVAFLVVIFAALLAPFLLVFGVANLIHPDVPEAYLAQNTAVCIVFSVLGLTLIPVAIAVYRGSILRRTKDRHSIDVS